MGLYLMLIGRKCYDFANIQFTCYLILVLRTKGFYVMVGLSVLMATMAV